MIRTRLALAALLLLAAGLVLPATAQDTNLLQQAGSDDTYTNRGRTDLNIPRRWGLWLAPNPEHPDWQNHVFAFPHTAPPEVRSGAASLNLSGGYITFTAAVLQQVQVERGTPLAASAWAWLHTCNLPRDRDNNIVGGICASSAESGAYVKIGIDPNGGINPEDSDIIWSAEARPHDRWEQVSVEAVATDRVVTVFLYVTQAKRSDLNKVYWDDAALVVSDSPTATVAPPPPFQSAPAMIGPVTTTIAPTAPAMPATNMSDYVVQPGDTLDLIALRFALSRAELLALNPTLDPRRLRVGERLRIGLTPES